MSDETSADVSISEVDMLDVDATDYQQQDLLDMIAQLEQRLQNAQTRIDSYQNERIELLARMIRLKSRSIELESTLQNVVDILEK